MKFSYNKSENHEELMEGLGTAFSAMGKSLTDIKKKSRQTDKPIPNSFSFPHPIFLFCPLYINLLKKNLLKNFLAFSS
jgi:hypothetical protein